MIKDTDLLDRGFSIGPLGHSWRLDRVISSGWYLLSATLTQANAISVRIWADSFGPEGVLRGDWVQLDRTLINDINDLDELIEDLYEGEQGPSMLENHGPLLEIN